MAVYERTYRPYTGELTPEKTRFLAIPRYAYKEIFRSRLFVAFFVLCFVWPLLLAIAMYLSYNVAFLKAAMEYLGGSGEAGTFLGVRLAFDEAFFLYGFTLPQFWASFFVAFIVGPHLISSDMRNNAMPLYLCRPFTRTEYILGKVAVMVILLSLITWIPGLLLYFLHGYLAGGSWLVGNLRLAAAILLGFWVNIALLTLISLALSAYVKWKPLARLFLIGVFIVAFGLGRIINGTLDTMWGSLVSLVDLQYVIWARMYDQPTWTGIPTWTAWFAMILFFGFCLLLLSHKVKAYEVVR